MIKVLVADDHAILRRGLVEVLEETSDIKVTGQASDGHMAFLRSPDNISIELLQKGNPLPVKEPWASMLVAGDW